MNRRKLLQVMENNNEKSPTVHTVILPAKDSHMAYDAVCTYEEMTGRDLPVPIDDWVKTVEKYPVELYFLFNKVRQMRKFVKEMTITYPDEGLKMVW